MRCLKKHINVRGNMEYNVLNENTSRAIIAFDDNDLMVLVDKLKRKAYILVPLTKNHTFERFDDCVFVDGERIACDMYWPDWGCQVLEYQGTAPKSITGAVVKIISKLIP